MNSQYSESLAMQVLSKTSSQGMETQSQNGFSPTNNQKAFKKVQSQDNERPKDSLVSPKKADLGGWSTEVQIAEKKNLTAKEMDRSAEKRQHPRFISLTPRSVKIGRKSDKDLGNQMEKIKETQEKPVKATRPPKETPPFRKNQKEQMGGAQKEQIHKEEENGRGFKVLSSQRKSQKMKENQHSVIPKHFGDDLSLSIQSISWEGDHQSMEFGEKEGGNGEEGESKRLLTLGDLENAGEMIQEMEGRAFQTSSTCSKKSM